MTLPVDGYTALQGVSVTLNAVAIDADTDIDRVEFYYYPTLIGNDSYASSGGVYTRTWTLPSEGTPLSVYSVTAKVIDIYGHVVESAAITINVIADGDLDGMSDSWEITHFGGINALPEGDYDNDGASNLFESLQGTNPNDDTDVPFNEASVVVMTAPLDGYLGWEGDYITVSAAASDADTEIDRVEFYYDDDHWIGSTTYASSGDLYSRSWRLFSNTVGISSFSITAKVIDIYGHAVVSSRIMVNVTADSDNDEMADDWELIHFGSIDESGSDDFDNDGATNLFEYLQGTHPNDDTDVPVNEPSIITMASPILVFVDGDSQKVTLSALASDPDTEIDRVEFYNGVGLIGTGYAVSTSDIYSRSWTLPGSGPYTVTAKVIDVYGHEVVSAPVIASAPVDSDDDQMPDDWETAQFGSIAADPLDDADGDRYPNIYEYAYASDPLDIASTPDFNAGHPTHFRVDAQGSSKGNAEASLSTAIEWAETFDYALIEVMPGEYVDALSIDGADSLLLIAPAGAATTTLSSDDDYGSAVEIESNVILDGFTLGYSRQGLKLSLAEGESVAVRNCVIAQNGWNVTNINGSGVYQSGGHSIFVNCMILDNAASTFGGAIYLTGTTGAEFINCTITDNTATSDGSALYLASATALATLTNSILWNPSASVDELAAADPAYLTSNLTFDHSLVRDGTVDLINDTIISASDPQLSATYHLTGASPAVNVGNSSTSGLSLYDLDGELRIDSGSGLIDLGADEFHDADSDLIADFDEANYYFTDSQDADSDGDLLSDFDEIFTHSTVPNRVDSDGDGLSDYDEVVTYLSDPLSTDGDGDGMPDAWEVQFSALDVNLNDATANSDTDGLTNSQEYQFGTDPEDADTDDDGLEDHTEVLVTFTDPLVADSDHDGLLDGAEVNAASPTDPLDRDSDDDQMPDGWEVSHQLDPLTDDAAGNPDGDTYLNLSEYKNGTDPQVVDAVTDLPGVGLTVATELE